jgi:hypothetical protein
MPRVTINDRVAALPETVKESLIEGARSGQSIVDMADKFEINHTVIQKLLWQSGTLPWQGAKKIITTRLKKVKTAGTRAEREQLADEIKEQVDYLYYAAKELQARWNKVKKLEES